MEETILEAWLAMKKEKNNCTIYFDDDIIKLSPSPLIFDLIFEFC